MAKRKRNGGGAAANAGSEYQHRIGAYISSLMIAGGELSLLVGSDLTLGAPTSMSYETLNPIDDINIVTDQGFKIYIQAKRSLSKAVLRAVLEQFSRQYNSEKPDQKTVYSLITSSRSSHPVSHHAKMVLEVLRAAPSEDFSPNHNEALQEVYKFLVEAGGESLKKAGLSSQDEDIRDFLQFVRIDVVDIEKDQPMEKVILLLLFKYASNEAPFLWDKLLKDNASAASNRMTMEKNGLKTRYQNFMRNENETTKWFYEVDINVKEIPVGIEYLLVEIPENREAISDLGLKDFPAGALVFWGTSRFDGDCQKTLKFQGEQCILSNGAVLKLLARAGSGASLRRILTTQKQFIPEELISNADNIVVYGDPQKPEVYNKSRCAMKYRPALLAAFENNPNQSSCLSCGRPAIEQGALTVEIDEEQSEFAFGIVHAECWKPTHRVTGTLGGGFLDLFPFLRRFDADAYIQALSHGQGAFTSLPAKIPETAFVMGWTGEGYNPDGTFCLDLELENGSHVLASHRGRAERLDKPIAEQKTMRMNERIRTQAEQGDPICIKLTDDGHVYGIRSIVQSTNKEPGHLLLVKFVKIVRFEEKIAKALDRYMNWYAPLCYFRRVDDHRMLTINRAIVLLTNPFSVASLAAALEPQGIDLREFEILVIGNDVDFDRFAQKIFDEECDFIVDPAYDEEGYLLFAAKIVRAV